MEANQIKDAHILDILFEGRNKEYGAYELRMTYNRRLMTSLFGLAGLIGLLFLGYAIAGRGKTRLVARNIDIPEDSLVSVREEVKPPAIPPVKVPPPQVATIRSVTIRIVPDNQVKQDERPPVNDDVDLKRIGLSNHDGASDIGMDGPPAKTGVAAGVLSGPKNADDGKPFTKVEVDAEFPGGPQAWMRFLNKNLRVPEDAISNGIGGTVTARFVVDLEGNVSDVEVMSGPQNGGLREEVIRVIKKSGKWVPAIQNGRHVKAYRIQPVTFEVPQE